jgi:hypothetical protein
MLRRYQEVRPHSSTYGRRYRQRPTFRLRLYQFLVLASKTRYGMECNVYLECKPKYDLFQYSLLLELLILI